MWRSGEYSRHPPCNRKDFCNCGGGPTLGTPFTLAENRNRWGLLDTKIVTILEAWVKKDPVYNLSSNKTEHINQ